MPLCIITTYIWDRGFRGKLCPYLLKHERLTVRIILHVHPEKVTACIPKLVTNHAKPCIT